MIFFLSLFIIKTCYDFVKKNLTNKKGKTP
jgi:hypothetical protein